MNPAQRAEIVDRIVGQIDAVLEESVRLQRGKPTILAKVASMGLPLCD